MKLCVKVKPTDEKLMSGSLFKGLRKAKDSFALTENLEQICHAIK